MDVEDDIERRKQKKKKQISNQNKLARARTHVRGLDNEYLFKGNSEKTGPQLARKT